MALMFPSCHRHPRESGGPEPAPGLNLTIHHKCRWTQSSARFTTEETVTTEKVTWINAVRPSRRPLRGLLRVRKFLDASKG
jgi:hypothetical protein